MAFWSGNKLASRIGGEQLITDFNPDFIDCAAYPLTLGGEVFTTADAEDRALVLRNAGDTPGIKKLSDGEKVTIQPGQFALLLTRETVSVPNDAIAFISVRAKRKLQGMINVSGFHVDPGWSSPLIFGVFNAGPKDLVLAYGEQLFLIFFADLDQRDDVHVYPRKQTYAHIPAKMIENMSGAVPSLYKLDKKASKVDKRIGTLGIQFLLSTGTAALALTIALTVTGLLFAKATFPGLTEARVRELIAAAVTQAIQSPAATPNTVPTIVPPDASVQVPAAVPAPAPETPAGAEPAPGNRN